MMLLNEGIHGIREIRVSILWALLQDDNCMRSAASFNIECFYCALNVVQIAEELQIELWVSCYLASRAVLPFKASPIGLVLVYLYYQQSLIQEAVTEILEDHLQITVRYILSAMVQEDAVELLIRLKVIEVTADASHIQIFFKQYNAIYKVLLNILD